MCRLRIERAVCAAAAAVTLGAMLAGCSDIYYARRDTIALSGGDAVAANAAEQTVDPWPPHSGDANIPFNGQKMQSAVERYRTNKVTPPADPQTLESTNQPTQPGSATTSSSSANTSSGSATSTTVTTTPAQ
jgi:hypothetical protein